jgi:diguanylate cyclase (GGDEF)-like protein/PAS domain S-box-containing protein
MKYLQVFNELTNSPVIGVCIYQKKEGIIVFANDYLRKLLGYNKDELLGKSLFELYPENSRQNIKENVEMRTRGELFSVKYDDVSLISKTNSIIKVQIFSHTIIYGNKPSGFVIVVDKTKEDSFKKLFFALSQINQLLVKAEDEKEIISKICRILVDTVGYRAATIGTIDEKTKLFKVEYSKSTLKEFEHAIKKAAIGVDMNTPCGRGLVSRAYNNRKIEIVPDVFQDSDVLYWKEQFEYFKLYSACSIPIFSDGKIKYILIMHDDMKNSFDNEKLNLIRELQADITFAIEKVKAQKHIKILNKAINATHEWVVISDAKGDILYANGAVSNISGYEKDEIVGNNPRIFKSGYHNKEFYKKLWNSLINGKQHSCRFVNKAKDGSLFYLDAVLIPVFSKGRLERIVDLSRDVTDIVKKSRQIEMSSKLYNTLYHINDLFIKSTDESAFFRDLFEIFAKYLEMDAIFVISKNKKTFKITMKSADNGECKRLIETIEDILMEQNPDIDFYKTPFAKSMIYKRVFLVNDMRKACLCGLKSIAAEFNVSSCCALPIIRNSQSAQSIVLVSRYAGMFNKDVYELLSAISSQIEFIIKKFEQDKFVNMLVKALNLGFDFVVITDHKFNIVYVNNATIAAFGYKKEELIGRHHSIVSSKTHTKEFVKGLYDTLKSGNTFSGMLTYKDKQGKFIYSYTTIVPHKINGKIKYYIAAGKNITNEKNLQNQLEKFAYYDQLTNLYNLRYFRELVEQFINLSERKKILGAVAMINPINFASINQAFGFDAGNEILKQIAQRLKDFLRKYDVVAKLESDRFGVLLKDLKSEEDILIIIINLLNKLKRPYKINESEISIPFNVGLSIYPKDGHDAQSLIDGAHIALMDAKQKGEGAIGFFREDFDKKVADKLKLKSNLEKAIAQKEFCLYYQPYVDINRNISGAESLLRWIRGGKIIPPSDFITCLEQTRLIVDVENYVLETVINKLSAIKKHIKISINFSEHTLKSEGITETIIAKINSSKLPKGLLNIEIIERSFMDDLNKIKTMIEKLKNYGVGFSIDDFGTGYSSLSYLTQLPVENLKIDISFIRKITQDKHTLSIVKSIILIAKELNIKTIAEGVETNEQFELLKKLGCDYFQGYLFYKPMPEDEFDKLLSKI